MPISIIKNFSHNTKDNNVENDTSSPTKPKGNVTWHMLGPTCITINLMHT